MRTMSTNMIIQVTRVIVLLAVFFCGIAFNAENYVLATVAAFPGAWVFGHAWAILGERDRNLDK